VLHRPCSRGLYPVWRATAGTASGFADVIIAATARRHDLVILSRNERHFAPMDAIVIDPFRRLPSGE
jgi:predicted nucleic acid-binding protein